MAGLWELVDGGADFDEVLDGLLAGGIRTLGEFVLVGHGEGTRALVRGGVTLMLSTAAGDTVVSGDGEGMWADRSLRGVTGGSVVLEGGGPADQVLVTGIARVGSLTFGDSNGVGGAAVVAPAVEAPESAPQAAPEERADRSEQSRPAAEETGSVEQDEPVADVVPIEAATSEPTPATGEPEGSEPLTFGAPTDEDPTPTGEQPAIVEPLADGHVDHDDRDDRDDRDDHDGHTTVGPPADSFVRPGIPGQELAPPVVSRPVAKLVLSTGEVVEVDRTIIVGRAPEARRFASSDQPRLVTVASPQHEISSTHLEIRPGAGADHGSAVVTDLGSTNGTVLVQPGLPPEDLQAGIAVSLIPGAVLDLGDGVTIQTTNP